MLTSLRRSSPYITRNTHKVRFIRNLASYNLFRAKHSYKDRILRKNMKYNKHHKMTEDRVKMRHMATTCRNGNNKCRKRNKGSEKRKIDSDSKSCLICKKIKHRLVGLEVVLLTGTCTKKS